jgi:hypothetical protein
MADISEIRPVQVPKDSVDVEVEHDESDGEVDLGAMKAKFSQFLSNFEQDRTSQTGTAYFNS